MSVQLILCPHLYYPSIAFASFSFESLKRCIVWVCWLVTCYCKSHCHCDCICDCNCIVSNNENMVYMAQ